MTGETTPQDVLDDLTILFQAREVYREAKRQTAEATAALLHFWRGQRGDADETLGAFINREPEAQPYNDRCDAAQATQDTAEEDFAFVLDGTVSLNCVLTGALTLPMRRSKSVTGCSTR